MTHIKRALSVLNTVAPLRAAEAWDNVGLLLEPAARQEVKRVLLTNDLTEAVWREAEKQLPDLIVSYHPPIFASLKRLVQVDWKSRILLGCARADVAVYSPHTALDNVDGGINDWLLRGLGDVVGSVVPIKSLEADKVVEGVPGIGRRTDLLAPLPLSECWSRLRTYLGLDQLMVTRGHGLGDDPVIRSVAVCAGSGGSLLCGLDVDLFLTGEMSHHELLDAQMRGTSVLLTTHSRSERGYLAAELAPRLRRELPGVEVAVAESDHDPIEFGPWK